MLESTKQRKSDSFVVHAIELVMHSKSASLSRSSHSTLNHSLVISLQGILTR
jgi:hypothetical protein